MKQHVHWYFGDMVAVIQQGDIDSYAPPNDFQLFPKHDNFYFDNEQGIHITSKKNYDANGYGHHWICQSSHIKGDVGKW